MMKLKGVEADHALLILSGSELRGMGNALNEICNGIFVADFTAKMGAEPDTVHQILLDMLAIYRKMKQSGSKQVVVRLSRSELRAIIGALKEVRQGIDAIEFFTRLGVECGEVDRILDEVISIYGKMKV
jgi:hypothetical protein